MLAYNEENTFALENTASAPCRDIAGAFIDIALSGRRMQKSGAGLAWKVDFLVARNSHTWDYSQRLGFP